MKIKTTQEKLEEVMGTIVLEGGEVTENTFEIDGVLCEYTFDGDLLSIDIQDKPDDLPLYVIEDKMEDIFK